MNRRTGEFKLQGAVEAPADATPPLAAAPKAKRDMRASYLDTAKRFPKTIARLGE
jgi:hypothetical protein